MRSIAIAFLILVIGGLLALIPRATVKMFENVEARKAEEQLRIENEKAKATALKYKAEHGG